MGKNTGTFHRDPLINMLHAATKDDLIELVKEIVGNDRSVRRICLDHLKRTVNASSSIQMSTENTTSREQAEEQLPESLVDYRTLFEQTSNGVAYHQVIFDEHNVPVDYIFIEINPTFEKYTGLTREIIGQKITDVHPGIEHGETDFIGIYGNVGLTGTPVQLEVYFEPQCHWYTISAYSPKKGFFVAEFDDITEIKKKEEKIQTAKEFLNKVIDLSMFGMWVSDKEGTVIQANRFLYETMNLTENKIIGKYNVFRDDNLKAQGVMPKVKSVFDKHQSARFTIPWRTARVSDVAFQATRDMYIDVYMFPILDTKGNLKNVVCQWLDITEQKQAEIALQKSETLLSQAEEIVGLGSWEWDIAEDKVYWSNGLFGIFERDPAAGAPNWADHPAFFVAEDVERTRILVEECLQHGTPYDLETRAIRSDGEIRHCVARGQAERGHGGTIQRLRGTLLDITERRQMEQKLIESQRNMSSVLNNTQDIVVRIDRNFRHVFANPALYLTTGFSPKEYLGKTNEEIGLPKELGRFWRTRHENILETGKPEVFEFSFLTKNKGQREFQAIVTPEFHKDGKVETIISFMRDITDLKQAESDKNDIIAKLKKTIVEVKTLRGLIPICSQCKKIRDDKGYWNILESYIQKHSDASFSHGICPDCSEKLYGNEDWYIEMKKNEEKK